MLRLRSRHSWIASSRFVVSVYFVLSSVYIVLSSYALSVWDIGTPGVQIEIAKGLVFVATTSLLLWCLLKRRDRQIAGQERRFEQVLDNLGDGLLTLRLPERTIEYVNPATERMFGYAASELLGGSTEKLHIDHSHFERFHQISLPDLEQNNVHIGNFEMRQKNGVGFPTSHMVTWFSNDDGQELAVTVVRDESERIRQEKVMRRVERLDALGQLAGGIAHDFNNHLGVIMSHVELILEGVSDNDPLRSDAERALTACDRAATLSKRLLGFAREEHLEPQAVDVNRLVRTLVDDVLARTMSNIDLETHLQPGLESVFTDPTELERALLNIAINARNAMPDGGSLKIATWLFCSPDHDPREEEYVAVSFEDTGVGMTPDIAERVFEPFFSTKAEGQGTGLGLSSAYGFVRQSGGDILVKSEILKGTTFTVLLPLAKRD